MSTNRLLIAYIFEKAFVEQTYCLNKCFETSTLIIRNLLICLLLYCIYYVHYITSNFLMFLVFLLYLYHKTFPKYNELRMLRS